MREPSNFRGDCTILWGADQVPTIVRFARGNNIDTVTISAIKHAWQKEAKRDRRY